MALYDTRGHRLYLNAEERDAVMAQARKRSARDRTLIETLHFTGCRPSELIEITPARIDLSGGTVTIRSLKKRKDAKGSAKIVYRAVPVPPLYLAPSTPPMASEGPRNQRNGPMRQSGTCRAFGFGRSSKTS
ncbi:hypothetical protein ROLI_048330 (plasmid) [Roseobacter fucihabitans]|uniref:Tyr recombinase domain-containing protein n=2 Tax=Roseobacter fucihabitans TaxID=1537242 RepID=A0ABZ2C2C0_9RHOB|nr:Phage integrase family protein [Roseobacter litoralis]